MYSSYLYTATDVSHVKPNIHEPWNHSREKQIIKPLLEDVPLATNYTPFDLPGDCVDIPIKENLEMGKLQAWHGTVCEHIHKGSKSI